MTDTPNLGLVNQTTGSNNGTWGLVLNGNQDIIDSRLGARLIKSVAGSSNITVTTEEAQNFIHTLTGVITGNIKYILPATGGIYFIKNSTTGAFTVTIVNNAAGTGVVIAQGTGVLVISNPDTTTVSSSATSAGSFSVDNLTVNTSISLPAASVANSALNTGTTANKLVVLDGSAKLPAVDGSQLTNLPSAPVSSVAGRTGAVTLSTTDISGLGTASALNVGTGANQIVQLNGSAKLPAVDGSLLTNLGNPVVTNSSTGRIVMGAVTMQWGTGTCNSSTSFGVAFSGTPYSIQGMSTLAGNAGPVSIPSGTWSSSGFTASAGGNNSFTYLAIGPT